jgi:anti-sigma B factor antagonist
MDQLNPLEGNLSSEKMTDAEGVPVLKLDGELDMVSAVGLREQVEEYVANRADKLVFDLTDLSFMDSSGIAVLVFASNSIDTVEFLNPSSIVRRIFAATGLSNVLGPES